MTIQRGLAPTRAFVWLWLAVLLGGFAAAGDAYRQREHKPLRPLVQPVPRGMVSRRGRADERGPLHLRNETLRLAASLVLTVSSFSAALKEDGSGCA